MPHDSSRVSSPAKPTRARPFLAVRGAALTFGLAAAVMPARARAGGFELPDNGTEALARGGAFVAKADDGSAIAHNPAGFAGQRGTRIHFDGTAALHTFTFQRAGAYPDDPENPATPWGQKPFPTVQNVGAPFVVPVVAASTDFGMDRFTAALGVFAPSTVAGRTFPLGMAGAPSPARYDGIQSGGLIAFPTLSAAYRVADWLDVGVSAHLAVAQINQMAITYADLGAPICPTREFAGCDVRTRLQAAGLGYGASVGVIARPSPSVALGLSVRSSIGVDAKGVTTSTPPAAISLPLPPSKASTSLEFPWVARFGVRYIARDEKGKERGDVELDGTYETWGTAQAQGPKLLIEDAGPAGKVETYLLHRYVDTFSVRLGGSYNVDVGEDSTFTLRAGAFYDSSATPPAYTRIDFDTLEKVGGTLGAGFTSGNVTVRFAYAAVASLSRTVDKGAIRPINPLKGGKSEAADGSKLPAVNEGTYEGFTHLLSVGLTVRFGGGR